MGSEKFLEDFNEKKSQNVSVETSIKDLVKIIERNKDLDEKYLSNSLQFCLIQLGKYVDTIGDLQKLSKNVDGFSRIKSGIVYNDERVIPPSALAGFGKKKLDYLNIALTSYGIDPIPWVTRKYTPWKKREEKGLDWRIKVKI